MNKVELIGNISADPEVRYTQQGTPVCNLSLATDDFFVNKEGVKQKNTEWHRLVIWGKAAEACGEHLRKGRQILVEGKLRTRKWTDKDGNTRTTTEVHSTQVTFLGVPKSAAEKSDEPAVVAEAAAPVATEADPFPS